MSSSDNHNTLKNKKRLFLSLFSSILLVTAIVSIVAGVTSSKNSTESNNDHQVAHTILKSSCSSTLYPHLCFSALSAVPDATSKIKSKKDVIDLSLNRTMSATRHSYFKIQKLTSTRRSFTERENTALHDCLVMLNETLDQLSKAYQELQDYPSLKKSLSVHADDLKILLSAAMTNQETCLDGFSHDKADKKVRELFIDEEMHVYHMSSIALAIIKNVTDTDMAKEQSLSSGRKLEEENGTEWPEWLSAGDRRLLQATTVTPNVVVAADGSGNYRTVSEAVAAAPERSSSRYIIRIKAGVYRENVDVPRSKTNIMFMGDGRTTTIITASRNVVDGSTTFNSATVAAVGDGFLARDITFQNSAGPSKHQAVAIRVGSDLSAFYRCDMIAYQDTLYVHSLRQFYVSCIIIGSVDFIFGNAAVVFQDCDIHARRPNPGQKNMVTAQGRSDPNENTGIVIQKCRIGATQDLLAAKSSFRSYLGRPWKLYSRTIVMQTEISDIIDPAGWFEWDGDFALDTLVYREYQNTGPGANTANRVNWKGFKVVTSAIEVQPFIARNFIRGASWLPSTGFPYSLDL
ncbi:hypothetical protein POPTR_018G051400v4 [Populus trichocarpa]|uniref:Uncharacterized protein n=1 Tax=Populus trichocarpa TaxID=3694 RepID=A0ACC0RLN9_POPTR|nr:pectinesterase [Populus trichocarpa]KAI5556528.1 hypothetical protein BDE02_18G042000 [Populus trichocarpa]KAI9378181.1 hypothetical protein POPTR_018G051400v4 [Populus trichocarpa]